MRTIIEHWIKLGLSEYEAKAYVALLRLGNGTGYQIAKESGVPRSMIYESLNKLAARGAVLSQSLGGTMRYAAMPPDKLFRRMQRELDDSVAALSRGLKDVATGDSYGTWNLIGRENILAYAQQMIEQAEHHVALCIGDDDELDVLLPRLRAAHERRIALLVVSTVPYDAGTVPVIVYPKGQQLRQAIGHGLTGVVDRREVLMGEVDRTETAVLTTNQYMVAWVLWCFEHALANSSAPTPKRQKKRGESK